MGVALTSVMDWRNSQSMVPQEAVTRYRAYGPDSVLVEGTGTDTTSPIYVNGKYRTQKELTEWRHKVHDGRTQAQRFASMCESFKDRTAITYRRTEKVVKERVAFGANGETKELDITYVSPRQDMTYGALWAHAMSFSRGLAELGLQPRSSIAIYEETRWEWLASIYGIWLQDMVAATVYANLGEDALFYALEETECKAIVCNGRSVPNLLRGIAAGVFAPCTIIYLDALPADGVSDESNPKGCRIVAWPDVEALGAKEGASRKAEPPSNNADIALIMYTSGTTGTPKGVMHTHGSLTAGILVMDEWLWSCIDRVEGETYCSYLPLAHILEFGVVNIFLAREALVAFGSPRTLTDITARPSGDLTEFRPTLMVGVPRIFDTVRRAVESKLPKPGTIKRRVFDHAYQVRLAALKAGKETPYYNEKVFKLPRAALGGRMRHMLSGGGPLSEATQEFMNVVFCVMVGGYGLTETICCGAIQRIGDLQLGAVGQVLVGEELRLLDTEHYKHTDQPEPRGELCLRGPFLFKGYYKQPELTKEALTEDGWFRTGDIGSISPEGKVRIVGRVKALAKNSLGEYIALETLESIYATHPLVLNCCVCVLVHPDRNYICALAITDAAKAISFAKANGIEVPAAAAGGSSPADISALLTSAAFCSKAAASLAALARNSKRQRFECVRRVQLVTDDWTPENGLLTAAMKLKRSVLEAQYKDTIEKLFADDES